MTSYYNVIVGYFDESGTSIVPGSRFYNSEDLPPHLKGKLPITGDFQNFCASIPTVFTQEISSIEIPMAQIGWITSIFPNGEDIRVEYRLASGIAPIPADRLAETLGLSNCFPPRGFGDMQRSHWEIRQGDIFWQLFGAGLFEKVQPSVFNIPRDYIQSNLVSVMMPFQPDFDDVYQALKNLCQNMNLECKKADDIWEDSTVIQDIFSLIYRSKIVICDFSQKNPNVFYEAGIAHALGREVIPIVQNTEDIPFDLRHHRYIQYLNNDEGRQRLVAAIKGRIETLMNV